MYKNKKILGVITARGGSKGILGKNIKLLGGKPLIVYTIKAARKAGIFDRLILSTDSEEIASVARRFGCEVPFLRPKKLAQDDTLHLLVIQHALRWLKKNEKYQSDYTMMLQPTAPLRQDFHIKEAVELILKNPDADSVLSVAAIPNDFNPAKAMFLNKNGILRLVGDSPVYERISRRQDLPKVFRSAGSFYLFRSQLALVKKNPNFYGEKTLPYFVEDKYIVDIDTLEDWIIAEKKLKKIKKIVM